MPSSSDNIRLGTMYNQAALGRPPADFTAASFEGGLVCAGARFRGASSSTADTML
jgi:hypothetical protein